MSTEHHRERSGVAFIIANDVSQTFKTFIITTQVKKKTKTKDEFLTAENEMM